MGGGLGAKMVLTVLGWSGVGESVLRVLNSFEGCFGCFDSFNSFGGGCLGCLDNFTVLRVWGDVLVVWGVLIVLTDLIGVFWLFGQF